MCVCVYIYTHTHTHMLIFLYIYIYQEGRGDSFEHFAPRRRLLSLETLVAPQETARYSVYLLYC